MSGGRTPKVWTPGEHGHLQGIEREVVKTGRGDPPADDHLAQPVDDERGVAH